jgi:hypothetical protein
MSTKFQTLINDYAMYGRDTKHMSQDQLYELCCEYMKCVKKYEDNDTLDVSLSFGFLSIVEKKEDDCETELEMYRRLRVIKSGIQLAVIDKYHSDVSEILDEKIEYFKHAIDGYNLDGKIKEAMMSRYKDQSYAKTLCFV